MSFVFSLLQTVPGQLVNITSPVLVELNRHYTHIREVHTSELDLIFSIILLWFLLEFASSVILTFQDSIIKAFHVMVYLVRFGAAIMSGYQIYQMYCSTNKQNVV